MHHDPIAVLGSIDSVLGSVDLWRLIHYLSTTWKLLSYSNYFDESAVNIIWSQHNNSIVTLLKSSNHSTTSIYLTIYLLRSVAFSYFSG